MRHKWERTDVALLLPLGFKSGNWAYSRSKMCNFLVQTLQYFHHSFAYESMKNLPSNIAQIGPNSFYRTAPSCPYNQKFNFRIKNLTKTPSVISTLCIEAWSTKAWLVAWAWPTALNWLQCFFGKLFQKHGVGLKGFLVLLFTFM